MNKWKGLLLPALAALVALAGCGGGGGGPSGGGVTFNVTSPVVATGASLPITAQASGGSSSAVTYSVLEGPQGGSISTSGVYTAPGTPGTYHVVATSVSNPTQSASITVTVVASGVRVSITPSNVFLVPGGSQRFTVTQTGAATSGVRFSVSPAGSGTIDASGNYVAPTALGTYQVVATSLADQTQSATATVTVAAVTINIPQVTLNNPQVTLGPGGMQTFTATIQGLSDPRVTFSVLEPNGGTITQAGVYTAPTNITSPQTFHVVASSTAFPSLSTQATVIVTRASGITVTLNPSTAQALAPGGSIIVGVNVSGTPNTAATVQLQGVGTLTPQGVYTAPADRGGTATITGVSVADPTKTAQVTVTVTVTPLTLTINPPSAVISTTPLTASLSPGGTLSVTTNLPATLTVQEGAAGGTITGGVYTAPLVNGTYHVVATTNSGPPQSVTLTIQVASGNATVTVQ